ncbi:hypothetical protein ACFLQ2_02235 [archaeon]
MKRGLMLILLISTVLAASALEKSDFSYGVKDNPVELTENHQFVVVDVKLDARVGVNAFDVVSQFKSLNSVQAKAETITVDSLVAETGAEVLWELKATQPGEYDLSNAFEVVSWDDSVALDVDKLPAESGEQTITISGWTDAATVCERHNFVGFWGERENCQVKITVGNGEYWAERSGVFTFEHELKEGENEVTITARDPGGNTEEKTVVIAYVPSAGDVAKENVIPIVVGIIAVIAMAGLFVLWRSKQQSKKVATEITEKALADFSLDELHEKQRKLFEEHIKLSQQHGGYSPISGNKLLYIFDLITKKDQYYSQPFTDVMLAIKEHEEIFKDEQAPPVIRRILLEQYSKHLQQQQRQVPE